MLDIGWIKRATFEAVWIGDPAYDAGAITDAAREEWQRTGGGAEALRPFLREGAKPQVIRYRTLTGAEALHCDSAKAIYGSVHWLTGVEIAAMEAFRIAGELVGVEPPEGVPKYEQTGGFRLMHRDFMDSLISRIETRSMVMFFGGLMVRGALMGDLEKKASSPPSTVAPSATSTSAAEPAPTEPATPATAATST